MSVDAGSSNWAAPVTAAGHVCGVKMISDNAFFFFSLGKANRWFGVAPPKSGKMNMNILHQEELIAQKKREIEAKMEQKAKQNQVVISPQPPHPGE